MVRSGAIEATTSGMLWPRSPLDATTSRKLRDLVERSARGGRRAWPRRWPRRTTNRERHRARTRNARGRTGLRGMGAGRGRRCRSRFSSKAPTRTLSSPQATPQRPWRAAPSGAECPVRRPPGWASCPVVGSGVPWSGPRPRRNHAHPRVVEHADAGRSSHPRGPRTNPRRAPTPATGQESTTRPAAAPKPGRRSPRARPAAGPEPGGMHPRPGPLHPRGAEQAPPPRALELLIFGHTHPRTGVCHTHPRPERHPSCVPI